MMFLFGADVPAPTVNWHDTALVPVLATTIVAPAGKPISADVGPDISDAWLPFG